VFVQRSQLQVPPETLPGRYWLQVGLYSLDTGQRLSIVESGQPVSDRILLTPVEVEP
jgi:hypothetical protein